MYKVYLWRHNMYILRSRTGQRSRFFNWWDKKEILRILLTFQQFFWDGTRQRRKVNYSDPTYTILLMPTRIW